jgi:hypothetical protein
MADPIQSPEIKLGIQNTKGEAVSESLKDDELALIIRQDLSSQESRWQDLIKIAKKNEDYWRGVQTDQNSLEVGDQAITVNRIMVSIETMCAIVTSETPTPWIIAEPRDNKGRELEGKLQRFHRDGWEYDLNMQQKMERLLRTYYAQRVGVLKVGIDFAGKKFTDLLRLEHVRFNLDVRELEDSHYFAHYLNERVDEIKAKFPDAEDRIQKYLVNSKGNDRSMVSYVEYWGHYYEDGKKHTYVCWMLQDGTILKRVYNPLWNEKGVNHFDNPQKPFIAMNSLSMGKSVVDDTSLIEQAIPLQDNINERKRQIRRNAEFANGIYVTHSNYMTKQQFGKINGKTRKVYLEGDNDNLDSAFRVVTGRAFESGIFDDMYHSQSELDNVFGTHDTTRGEKTSGETLGGQAMRRNADHGRLDLTSRAYEQVAEEVFNWWIQLLCVSDEKYPILTPREETRPIDDYKKETGLAPRKESEDYISAKDLKGYKVRVIVKKGSTRPKDPVSSAEDAVMLLQTGMLDPMTFAEMYGLENPRKTARRMHMWADPNLRPKLFPELEGTENMIHPIAINHIIKLNKGADPAASVYQEFTDSTDLSNHVQTHTLYMQGAEVDEDLKPFDELDEEEQMQHKIHLKFEADQLQLLMSQEANPMGAMGLPEEMAGMEVPEEAMPGAEMMQDPMMGGNIPAELPPAPMGMV